MLVLIGAGACTPGDSDLGAIEAPKALNVSTSRMAGDTVTVCVQWTPAKTGGAATSFNTRLASVTARDTVRHTGLSAATRRDCFKRTGFAGVKDSGRVYVAAVRAGFQPVEASAAYVFTHPDQAPGAPVIDSVTIAGIRAVLIEPGMTRISAAGLIVNSDTCPAEWWGASNRAHRLVPVTSTPMHCLRPLWMASERMRQLDSLARRDTSYYASPPLPWTSVAALPGTLLDTRMPEMNLGPDTLVSGDRTTEGVMTIAAYRLRHPGFRWPA